MNSNREHERHYFVDEAGDLTLFNRRGKVIIGTEGCSKYFVLGCVLVENPHEIRQRLVSLKDSILMDPYLKGVPALKKTKVAFHATDDCPEVKMTAYKFIKGLPIKFYAIIRRKDFLVEWVRKQNQFDIDWHYDKNKIYDACVKRLFKDRLHQTLVNHITFARRGNSPRNEALSNALRRARENFENTHQRVVGSTHQVASNYPSNEPALSIIDYGVWALQRIYEKHEERYFDFLKGQFVRIIDLDDKRFKEYGVYYDEHNLLTVDKIKDSLKG